MVTAQPSTSAVGEARSGSQLDVPVAVRSNRVCAALSTRREICERAIVAGRVHGRVDRPRAVTRHRRMKVLIVRKVAAMIRCILFVALT